MKTYLIDKAVLKKNGQGLCTWCGWCWQSTMTCRNTGMLLFIMFSQVLKPTETLQVKAVNCVCVCVCFQALRVATLSSSCSPAVLQIALPGSSPSKTPILRCWGDASHISARSLTHTPARTLNKTHTLLHTARRERKARRTLEVQVSSFTILTSCFYCFSDSSSFSLQFSARVCICFLTGFLLMN